MTMVCSARVELAVARLRDDPTTRAYAARRRADGKSPATSGAA
jgi:hypothetical protein